jgi:hypothetical protein
MKEVTAMPPSLASVRVPSLTSAIRATTSMMRAAMRSITCAAARAVGTNTSNSRRMAVAVSTRLALMIWLMVSIIRGLHRSAASCGDSAGQRVRQLHHRPRFDCRA